MCELFALLKSDIDEHALIAWIKVGDKIVYFDYLPSNATKYQVGTFNSVDEAIKRLRSMIQNEWWCLVDGTAKEIIGDDDSKKIKIVVKGGVVVDVQNLPEGYDYKVIDEDIFSN